MDQKNRLKKVNIKKNDNVIILSGRDRGKQGRIIQVDYKNHLVSVEGMNILKKAVRPNQQNQKGGIIEVSEPLPISKVKLVCPKCNKPTKVTRKRVNDKVVRICKRDKCKEMIDKI